MNQHFQRYLLDNNPHRNSKLPIGSITLEPHNIEVNIPLEYILINIIRRYENYLKSYTLQIKGMLKSFERVRNLTSGTLSGGERSFSIALLILSMKSLLQTPFCIMDEV